MVITKVVHPLSYTTFLFDADETLRRCTVANQPCPNQPGEWELAPNVTAILGNFYTPKSHYRFGIISNQGGVALGFLSHTLASTMLYECGVQAFRGRRFDLYMCPHSPDDHCPCRKPSPYAILRIAFHRRIPLHDILYVGDLPSDQQCAERAGVDFCHANVFFQR